MMTQEIINKSVRRRKAKPTNIKEYRKLVRKSEGVKVIKDTIIKIAPDMRTYQWSENNDCTGNNIYISKGWPKDFLVTIIALPKKSSDEMQRP